MLHACADRDENGSHLKKIDRPNPILIETRSYRRPSGRRLQAVRPKPAAVDNQLCVASLRLFWRSVTLSTSTYRHYDERVHRIKQLTRGNNTIPYHTTTLVTFETRRQSVYRGPFISEHCNFALSTALFHVTRSHGKSAQAPIRL